MPAQDDTRYPHAAGCAVADAAAPPAEIRCGVAPSPFGSCFVATADDRICGLSFVDDERGLAECEQALRAQWPATRVVRDDAAARALVLRLFSDTCDITGATATAAAVAAGAHPPLRLLLQGSAFQRRVWESLLAIPAGETRSYRQVAEAIGRPSAVRAVASAIARNDIGWLIPCHRVVRSSGEPGHYRWGDARKRAMIDRERNLAETHAASRDAACETGKHASRQ